MISRYMQFVSSRNAAAILSWRTDGEVFANSLGRQLYDPASEHFDTRFAVVAESRALEKHDIAGTTTWFIPLFSESDDVDAVLAIDTSLASLPEVMYDLYAASRNFAHIIHSLPQIVLTARPNGRIDYMSQRWFEVFDTASERRSAHDGVIAAIGGADLPEFEARWNAGIARGAAFSFELQMAPKAGIRWFNLQATPWTRSGSTIKWSVVLTDIEETVRSRISLEKSQQRLRLSADIGQALVAVTEPGAMAQAMANLIHRWNGNSVFIDIREQRERIALAAAPQHERARFDAIAAHAADSTNAIVRIEDACIYALKGSERFTGFIAVSGGNVCDEDDDVRLMLDVCDRLIVALESSARHRREKRIANTLQRAMLPLAFPDVSGLDFDVTYWPAGSETLVGGDWYDAFLMRDGRLAFSIGDVAGHGLDAAIVMNDIRRTVRAAALESFDPALILRTANNVAVSEAYPMITVFFGVLDPLTLRLDYASAGHPMPIVVNANGHTQQLLADGPPLGAVDALALESRRIQLEDNAAVVLYTDGVIEARRDLAYSEAKLDDVISAWAKRGFSESANSLQQQVLGDDALSDDAALFVLRLSPLKEFSATFRATSFDSHRARIALARTIRQSMLPHEEAADFILAVAEAMNNAAEHAYHDSNGTVRVHVKNDPAAIVAEIEDNGHWQQTSSPNRGRGIQLMKALTHSCDILPGETGTTVRLAMRTAERRRSAR